MWNNRNVIKFMGWLMLFMLIGVNSRLSAQKKPNIIIVLADDLGWGDVGFNGQQKIKTPYLDRMAAEGMKLSQFYAGSAVCAPSRAALLTGVNTAHAHIRGLPEWALHGRTDLLNEEVTIGEELQRAGYKTAIIGKWGMEEGAGTGMPGKQGFDYFYGYKTHMEAHHYYPAYMWENGNKIMLPQNKTPETEGDYSNDVFTQKALSFINENKSQPFFLYLPYTIPHNEITVPEASKTPYLNLGWEQRPMQQGHYYHDPEGNTTYAGMVSRLDSYIGMIREALRKLQIDQNTLVLFTSDNGPGFDRGFFNSSGPYRGRKLQLYEGGIIEPTVAVWPSVIKPQTENHTPLAFWDILPTVCDMADIKPSKKIDGLSFLPVLQGETDDVFANRYLYWEINPPAVGPSQAVRWGNWKGLKFLNQPFELYDLSVDRGESKNVAKAHPEVVAALQQFMKQTRTENIHFPLTKRSANKNNK
ncbi:arylsulfatase [Niabella insulamsoli]|uniref:arylsulfatase n=1 Tax=Niabella insulamsoli TaxID=3144874 RepID=UPI0031FBBE44